MLKMGYDAMLFCQVLYKHHLGKERVAQADDPKQAKIDFINRQAMGRLAQPEEIASLGCLFSK